MPKAGVDVARRRAPEIVLAVLAGVVFLGCLGAVDLWGKREQRAVAESIDTLDHGHWLVAEIQGRKRLEKPPLPRWTTATLLFLSGRRNEFLVRLPAALSALGMVALAYALGRRIAGRSAGLAAGLLLTSCLFFVAEMRQAGNDGPLAFFTTLALYAAWRRLHGDDRSPESVPVSPEPTTDILIQPALGSRAWSMVMYAALGLGFLCKGPVVLMLVGVTVVPYLVCAGRTRDGLRALLDGWGVLLFLVMALGWPVLVLLDDPNAARVWYLEILQKAGSGVAGIKHQKDRELLVLQWPGMTAPWSVLALLGVALPLRKRGRGPGPAIWFPWWWAVGNLAIFCLWTVAKPNYYLPCLPGVALLAGIEWDRLTRAGRLAGRDGAAARRVLGSHWVVFGVIALIAPVVVGRRAPDLLVAAVTLSVVMALGVVLSARAWRRGADAMALAPLVGAVAVGVVVGYGLLAPSRLAEQSHRALAATLDRLLPPQARTIRFFRQIDEGLWFYLHGRALRPVPGTEPRYNTTVELVDEIKSNTIIWDPALRVRKEGQLLTDWLKAPHRDSEYVLIRARVYDILAPDLVGLAEPVHREHGLKRTELVLLHAPLRRDVAGGERARR